MITSVEAETLSAMDAQDNGSSNPFSNPICSLEWIACAMDAARRHKQLQDDQGGPNDAAEPRPARADDAA